MEIQTIYESDPYRKDKFLGILEDPEIVKKLEETINIMSGGRKNKHVRQRKTNRYMKSYKHKKTKKKNRLRKNKKTIKKYRLSKNKKTIKKYYRNKTNISRKM